MSDLELKKLLTPKHKVHCDNMISKALVCDCGAMERHYEELLLAIPKLVEILETEVKRRIKAEGTISKMEQIAILALAGGSETDGQG